jgi:hypothetical protein
MPDEGMTQDAGAKGQQVGSARDVHQMKLGDLVNLANQQNIDISPVTDLAAQIQADIDAGNIDIGDGEG